MPPFRRIWHISTIMWGEARLLDAILRVIIAHTPPVTVVPALIMQVITIAYYVNTRLW